MSAFLRRHLSTIAVAMVTAAVTAGGPALAAAVQQAVNADKVDGKHAVGAGATVAQRAGKLVATNSGGRLPNNIITKAPNADRLDGLDSSQVQRRFRRTIVVSPTGTPPQNGAALRKALTSIPSSGSSAPTQTAPWLILLEPGTYNIGTNGLQLRPWVDIHGSGINMTTITCACADDSDYQDGWTVRMANNSRLEHLSVNNTGGLGAVASGIVVENAVATVDHVRVRVTEDAATGVFGGLAGDLRILNSEIIAFGPAVVGFGLLTSSSGGVLRASNSRISGNSYAVWRQSGTISVATSELSGSAVGAATCFASYSESFTARQPDCSP